MPPSQIINLDFPFNGLNETEAKRRQPQGTTPDCLNVRPFDGIAQQRRGSQRGGLSKYLTNAVNGSNFIQAIDQATLALDPTTIIADTEIVSYDFTADYASGDLPVLDSTNWPASWRVDNADTGGSNEFSWIDRPAGTTTAAVLPVTSGSGILASNSRRESALHKTEIIGTNYVLRLNATVESGGQAVGMLFRVKTDYTQYYVVYFLYNDTTSVQYHLEKFTLSGNWSKTAVTNGTASVIDATASVKYEWRMSGNSGSLYVDDQFIFTETGLTFDSNTGFGIGAGERLNNFAGVISNFTVLSGISPASLREVKLTAVSGGNIYGGNQDGLTLSTGGENALDSATFVDTQEAYQKTYFSDGNPENLSVLTHSTNTVTKWGAAISGLGMPLGSTSAVAAADAITVVNQGTKKFTVTANLSSTISANDWIRVTDSTGNDGSYLVTAITDASPSVITVAQAIPDSTADGNAIEADACAKYITLYRGRAVGWGLFTDPQNWFMSAVGDFNDWDYAPTTTTQTQAVAGNNSDAGLLGDVLNCCAPYSDDLMYMGGDHTLWVMRGDPAAGGVIDNVSYQTGIAGPYAFAWDPDGTFYFVGGGKLWKIPAGTTAPESISRGRMDNTFRTINYKNNVIRLVWDVEHQGLIILLVPLKQPDSGSEPTHVFWDRRTDSFWKDQYPATAGPTVLHSFDADEPDDRAILLGGWDSYIRRIDSSQPDDDGTAIASHVWYRPILLSDMSRVRITEIRAILGTGSDAVRLEVHASDTAENLIASTTARFTKTLGADRNRPIIKRAVGNAIGIKLVNDSASLLTWVIESMTGRVTIAGRQRQGVL